jgi:hypothetical protein
VAAAVSAFVASNSELFTDVGTQAATGEDGTTKASHHMQQTPKEAPEEAGAAASLLQFFGV